MSRHTLLFLIPSPLKNAHTSKTRNCFSIFVFPSRYSSPSLSPSLFSSLFLRIFKSSLIFVWNEYRISNWWPQSTAKPSFISTFWLAISQGQARFGRSFHSTKTSVVTSENKIWSPWFSASIDIPRFVNFSPGPYSRLQHVCIYMCVCISIRCIDDRSTILRIFVLFERRERERERRMRSHDWRQDITVPPARPFVPLCRTDRSTGSADYVPAFYDRTPSRLVSTIIFAFLPALSLQQRQALVRQFKKQQVTLRHPSNWPTFFSLSLVFLA